MSEELALHYLARAEKAEALLEVAREALTECEETMRLVERPAFVDPAYGSEVEILGARIGFGALMTSASASWRKYLERHGTPVGGEFVAGPCHASVLKALNLARSAIAKMEEGK